MSQPDQLPKGIWEQLLPPALSLIDEIRVHGGVADPFYTFGGGTVLMLRYNHRLSKDIDIFVPDPQSLNYVNPRLSDRADTLCNSQYSADTSYVKLNLALGEIDFVASPNLLPDAHAFERWDIAEHSVRVETAAEIVAKKMYHRGGRATARDLFDLAMVIEHEPEALKLAQPFFYRHADRFIEKIAGAGDAFINQFNNIMMLTYKPTFAHAADVARAYINEIKQDLARSAVTATAFAENKNFKVKPVDEAKGRYIGPILLTTSHHAVQQIDSGSAVIHEKHKLPVEYQQMTPIVPTEFRYSHGSALAKMLP